jgi:cell division protein FtsW (lipid II flippase)
VPAQAGLVLLAGLLATAELAAAGVTADLSIDQVGALLVPGVALLMGSAALLDRGRRPGAEAAAALAGLVALGCAAADVGWLSWTLAGLGATALATALHPDRRRVAALGALLLAASSWVRLADAGVQAPEPYVLPIAAFVLGVGHLRRRSDPTASSWAYAPGLSLALVPSLLFSLEEETLTRSLLVGLAALVVVLLGARGRLQAPLVVGALVLGAVAVDLVGPYAAALPRWLSLGAAGALLLVVGATYEQRRRDLERLRARYDALA